MIKLKTIDIWSTDSTIPTYESLLDSYEKGIADDFLQQNDDIISRLSE